jgi:hypothetical protein
MRQIVLRPPKASVNIQQSWKRSLTRRQAHVKELIRISAVCHSLVKWRRRQAENVFGGHINLARR